MAPHELGLSRPAGRCSRYALHVAALILGGALLAPTLAAADEPSAESLFAGAVTDMRDRHYQAACPALRRSYKADPRPLTLFTLAECEEKAGRIATAVLTYDDYLIAFDRLSPAEQKEEREREQLASSRKEALERDLPRITLTLPQGAPEGARVLRKAEGSADLVPMALNIPLPIDPGEHLVTVDAPGRPRWDRRFFVQKGDKKTIELEVPLAPKETAKPARVGAPVEPVPAYLPPLNPGISGQRVGTYIAGGIGIAGVLAGLITGAIVWGDKKTIEGGCENHLCNPSGEAAADRARAVGIVSTVLWSVGLAGVATSVVLYVTEPKAAKLGVIPNRVFISSADPQGGSVGMKWYW